MSAGTGDEVNVDHVRAWLRAAVDPTVGDVTLHRLGGHSGGARRVDAVAAGGRRRLVLKAPGEPSPVYRRDAAREARILDGLHRAGAPVPEVIAVATGADATGLGRFLMSFVDGRSVADATPAGYHDDAGLRSAGPDAQRHVWESFHDALAAVHAVDPGAVPDARLGDAGVADVLAHWRAGLLDAVPATTVPRQLAVLDWLAAHVPPGGDESPALCMGDARLVNGILVGTEVRALVDFEVAYVGNPAADVAYSLLLERLARRNAADPLVLPSADETWRRWSRATGRPAEHRDYWTVFGAMVLCVTATRAMVQWGLAGDDVEAVNPVVGEWEAAVRRASR